MARNRRHSSVTSYKSTIGLSCLKLLLTCTIVVLCVTKVIVGGEFISACPVEPLLPVYVVISGCLPVLLSPLRIPVEAGDNRYENKCCRMSKFAKTVMIIGIITNAIWLIIDTVLLTNMLSIGNYLKPYCGATDRTNESEINSTSVNTTPLTIKTSTYSAFIKNVSDTESKDLLKDVSQSVAHVNQTSIHIQPLTNVTPFPTQEFIGEGNETAGTNLNKPRYNAVSDLDRNKTGYSAVLDKTRRFTNGTVTTVSQKQDYNTTDTHSTFTSPITNMSKCNQCHYVLVRFTLAIVVIDWICVLCGILFASIAMLSSICNLFERICPFQT